MQHQNSTKSPNKGQQHSSVSPSPSSVRTRSDVVLSQNKVRAIMKSSPEVEHVGNDALFMVTKAAVRFTAEE